jgi:hypothetical protein
MRCVNPAAGRDVFPSATIRHRPAQHGRQAEATSIPRGDEMQRLIATLVAAPSADAAKPGDKPAAK